MISDEQLEYIIELEKEAAHRCEQEHGIIDGSSITIIQCLEELQQRRWQANIGKERLTGRSEDGAYYKKCFEEPCNGKGGNCKMCYFQGMVVCERLAAYEDTGLLPEQMRDADKMYQELCEETKELKQLEEQGRVFKTPLKIGDIVWDNDFGTPYAYEVTGFGFGNLLDYIPDTDEQNIVFIENPERNITGTFSLSELGKTVFRTREEAWEKLKKE